MAQYHLQSGVLTCTFAGQLDADACESLWDEIEPHLAGSQSVVFDMAPVEYVSSAFLRVCIQAARASDFHFRVINSSPAIKRVFDGTGLADRLHVE